MMRKARRRSLAAAVATALVAGLATPLLALGADPVAVVTVSTSRSTLDSVYNELVLGDFTVAGNSWMTCDATVSCDHRIGIGGTGGPGTPGSPAVDNGNVAQHFVGAEAFERRGQTRPELATALSSAYVDIPAGASVVKAVLTWAGDHDMGAVQPLDNVGRVPRIAVGEGPFAFPAGAASTYWSGGAIFGGTADVTSAFSGVTGPVYVSAEPGPLSPTGSVAANSSGGWAVTVVYSFPDAAAAQAAGHFQRRVQIQEGYYWVPSNSAGAAFAMTFDPIPVDEGVHVGFIGSEGDRDGGDWFRVVGSPSTNLQPPWAIAESVDGRSNFAISVAQGAVPFGQLAAPGQYGNIHGFTPVDGDPTSLRWYNNFSIDAFDWVPQESIWSIGQSSLDLQAGGTADGYRLHQLALSTPVAQLSLQTTVDRTTFLAGDDLTFTYVVTNTSPIRVYTIDLQASVSGSARTVTHVSGGTGTYPADLSLAPGESATFTATYTAVAGDQTAGTIEAQAEARGLLTEGSADWSSVNAGVQQIEVAVTEPPVITTTTLPDAVAGTPYTLTVGRTGTEPITFSPAPGSSLPAWLSLSAGGALSGTPTTADATGATFTVRASNAAGTVDQSLTIRVDPGALAGIRVTPSTTTVDLGSAVTYVVEGVDAHGNSRGTVPGAALSSSVAEDDVAGLTVTPSGPGQRTVTATVAGPPSHTAVADLTVVLAPSITSGPPPRARAGTPYSHTLVATGHPAPTFGLVGTLPAGLALDPVTGVISGTPLAHGSTAVTFTATNSRATSTQAATVVVDPAPAVQVSAGSVLAGDSVRVSGVGFDPGETLTLTLRSDPVALGTVVADQDGAFSVLRTVPLATTPGAHQIHVVGQSSGRTATAPITVTAPVATDPGGGGTAPGDSNSGADRVDGAGTVGAAGLSETGGSPAALVAGSLTLLLAGALLLIRRRTGPLLLP